MNIKFKEYFLNPFTVFLAIWGILNLLQARFTPLNNDEAYYWMYSKYLAWGYFDHPPMIALMIRIGYLFFQNELGVRLIVVLPVCNIYGFIATPDAPLILFSAVFLLAYKRFLEEKTWKNTIFLGFTIAALMYLSLIHICRCRR